MKKLTLVFGLFLLSQFSIGQEIKNLHPSKIEKLDFSEKAQNEWALRDDLLNKMAKGEISWDKMKPEEQSIIYKYGEVYENIWDIVGGGCSWYCGGGPEEVTASSYLKSQGSNNYGPKNAHDLNYKNAWVEGVPGYGIGEFITYKFTATAPRITKIIVVNGYVKSETAYLNNSRVKKLKVYLNDKPYAILNLEDKIANQEFKVEPIGNSDRNDWDVLKTKPDWTLKFEILDVYKGLKYDDVAISEIYFNGLDVHCFAKGTKITMGDNSTKNIENLRIGDFIAYWDFQTHEIKSAKVEKLEQVIHCGLVTYKFESGLTITATKDHPFLLKNKEWASLDPEKTKLYEGYEKVAIIEIGDIFLAHESTETLIEIKHSDEEQITYTISKLSSGDNFIANGLIVGIEEYEIKNGWQQWRASIAPQGPAR